MGISGLLPVLKSITETKSIEEYNGYTLAIDGYCWLHRAIYSCSQEICLGQETDKYVTYFMDRITTLQRNGVIPYVVFDGGPIPMKKGTEGERRKSRQTNRALGMQHLHNKRFSEARKCFIRAADVSPYMAHRVIQHLKKQNVLYVVAPYEADAQLAYLVKSGLADGVITEDSDCLPYGCQVVLFKMNRDNVVEEIQMANLTKNKGMSFHMFTEEMFLEMCIFSGCDYLPSIPGFGLKKAYNAMKLHGSFTKIIRALRLEGKVWIPATYEDDFRKAVLTFRHQRVYCPQKKELVPLTPIPPKLLQSDPDMDFVGPLLPSAVAKAIADGDMDPITMTRFPAHTLLSRCSSFQPSVAMSKEKVAEQCRVPLLKAKTETGSFVHASKSAAAPVTNAPRSSQVVLKRKLPPSFVDKRASQSVLRKKKRSQKALIDSAAKNVAASSRLISRFFGKTSDKMALPDKCVTKTLPCLTDTFSYQSQDAFEVDMAKDISFEPPNDEHKVLLTQFFKKKQALDCHEAVQCVTATAKETAFSRMMRAGSIHQQQRLKIRKVATPKCHQLYQDFVSSHNEQCALSDNAISPNISFGVSVEVPMNALENDGQEKHTCTPAVSKTKDNADMVATVSTISHEHLIAETITDEEVHSPNIAKVGASIASFDRFRFQS